MKHKWVWMMWLIVLSGCSKPPELEAPCHHFGRYCAQLPINEISAREVSHEV
ncbi:MAG: hypothetical protein H0U75_08805 [Legionella sp.]|nr:hypothetical protein [Legionella sp.]